MRPDAYGGDRTREEKSVECQQIFLCWTGRSRGAPASSTPGVISSTQNTTLVKNTCHLLLFFMIQQATDNIWVLNGEHCICISELAARSLRLGSWRYSIYQDPVSMGINFLLYTFKHKLNYIVSIWDFISIYLFRGTRSYKKRYIPLNPQQSPLRLQLHSPQPVLIQNKHLSIPSEAEISRTPIHQNATQQYTPGRPNRDSITAAAVHVALEIAFDAIGDTNESHGEETTVG